MVAVRLAQAAQEENVECTSEDVIRRESCHGSSERSRATGYSGDVAGRRFSAVQVATC